MARSRVDLPDPFRPMTPTTSPWLTTKEMPRMACTSRIEARRCRLTTRISEVAAVPLSPPAPYTRYTTCRSSTITVGSATAVPRFRLPEEQEPDHEGEHRPARTVQPELAAGDLGVAVSAVVQEVRV